MEQHYYEDAAFEDMAMAELSSVGLLPEKPEPVRVDRFIEKRFGVIPGYEDLPPGVMGFTKFGPSEIEAVRISRALSEEGRRSAERLINSTLAHEAGHMIMHKGLFTLQVRQGVHSLLPNDIDLEKGELKCRSDTMNAGSSRTAASLCAGGLWSVPPPSQSNTRDPGTVGSPHHSSDQPRPGRSSGTPGNG